MPIVCKYIPNRSAKRTFKASDVGRVACYAKQAGATDEEIIAELKRRCMPNLCEPSLLEQLEDMLLDVLTDLLTGRAARIIKTIRDFLRRFGWGRKLEAKLAEIVQSIVSRASKMLDVIKQLQQT